MSDQVSPWDDVRRMVDEIELQMHLAGMEARDRWHELEPRVEKLEHTLHESGGRVTEMIAHELSELGDALKRLRDELLERAHGNFTASR